LKESSGKIPTLYDKCQVRDILLMRGSTSRGIHASCCASLQLGDLAVEANRDTSMALGIDPTSPPEYE
jgi:hypothetical protein